jgi:uncharacterized membrane protein YphA (DoxX/SURF4 family)
MIQSLFVLSDMVFFLIRIAVALFFLRDAREIILQKTNKKNIFEILFLLWEIGVSVLLVVGIFTQIAAFLLIIFLVVQKSRSKLCSFLETEMITLFVFLSLLLLLTVGGGVWSVDNMLQIVIY